MDLAILLLRTLFFYFLIMLVIYVFMKKRKITLADLLIFFMIAQFSVLAIDKPGKPLYAIILPMMFLVVLHLLVKPLFTKKRTGDPMEKFVSSYMPENDNKRTPPLLRPQAADVEMAALEPVVLPIGSLPLPLILDGKVLDRNLDKLGKTRFWLKNEVQKFGVRRFREVTYCSMDGNGRMFLDKKKS